MLTRWRLATPARLSVLFFLVAGTLVAALAWLWQSVLAEERREADRQHVERLDNAAAVLAQEVARRLDAWRSIAHASPRPAARSSSTV